MTDERLGDDLGEKLDRCLMQEASPLPPHSVMLQSWKDARHVSEQRLQGCGQRAWDHHLENRGELGCSHTFLITQDLGGGGLWSPESAKRQPWYSLSLLPLETATGQHQSQLFLSLTPPGCLKQVVTGGGNAFSPGKQGSKQNEACPLSCHLLSE